MTSETWKPIPGFPGYEVSDMGRVRSYKKTGFPHLRFLSPRILKATPDHHSYSMVSLRDGGISHRWKVHQLVMFVFVGPCPEGLEVCHNDGNRLNNQLNNLRYDTHSSNMKDVVRHKGAREIQKLKRKFLALRVPQIRTEYANRLATVPALSKKYGIDARTISQVINGKLYPKAGGPIKGIDYQINRKTA